VQVTDRLISVVDDDASVRAATVDLLASVGFLCEDFASAAAYLQSDAANRTLCLILDVRMPGLSGVELQRLLADQGRIVPIIFITSFRDERSRRQAIEGGAICYLLKPYSDDELLHCVRLALEPSGPAGHWLMSGFTPFGDPKIGGTEMTNGLVGDFASGRLLCSAALLRLLRARTVTITSAIAIAACFTSAFAGPSSKTDPSVGSAVVSELESAADGVIVERTEMRVSELQAGTDAAEVERMLGRPTRATSLHPTNGEIGDYRVLVYDDEPLRPSITIESGHVTAIELDLTGISAASLPARARRFVKPMMVRSALLGLLGRPSKVEHWIASGLEVEKMLFRPVGKADVSVFLAGGVVVDVKPGDTRPSDIQRLVLPAAIPIGLAGTNLRIGMTPDEAAALMGPPEYAPTTASFKGRQVFYATYSTRDGDRRASLTFADGVLTAFSIWRRPALTCC
jgi:DNA-binding response OmpR family regulator